MDCGLLIAIEGIDGCGKTTQARMLAESLKALGYNVVLLKEPTDGKYGARIKEALKSKMIDAEEMYRLFLLDREENVKKNILPALREGKIVIVDRYFVSTIAYQGASGIPLERILRDNAKFPKPDLIVILDVPVDEAARRLKASRRILDEFEVNRDFLEKVRDLYLRTPLILADANVLIIDATKSKEEIHRRILSAVLKLIKERCSK